MQVRFKCKCGARLRCSPRGIGQVRPCPGCSAKVTVPSPGSTEVQRALKEVPHALPGKSGAHYLGLARQICADAAFNVELCNITGHPDLASKSVNQAKRILRNIAVFIDDSDRAHVPQGFPATSSVVNALASVAAGHDFAGIGIAKERARDHRIWQEEQSNNPTNRSGEQHPLRGQVLAAIAAVESLLHVQ